MNCQQLLCSNVAVVKAVVVAVDVVAAEAVAVIVVAVVVAAADACLIKSNNSVNSYNKFNDKHECAWFGNARIQVTQ